MFDLLSRAFVITVSIPTRRHYHSTILIPQRLNVAATAFATRSYAVFAFMFFWRFGRIPCGYHVRGGCNMFCTLCIPAAIIMARMARPAAAAVACSRAAAHASQSSSYYPCNSKAVSAHRMPLSCPIGHHHSYTHVESCLR